MMGLSVPCRVNNYITKNLLFALGATVFATVAFTHH
jgi:hypothetical protein